MISNYNPFNLKGKTILITGASSGIGRSIAIECSKMDAKVIITARNIERLQETYSLLDGSGHNMIPADITNEQNIINLIENLPYLNGVVHNSGIGKRALCKDVKESDIDNIMNTNFKGTILLQRNLLKYKKLQRESSIVFIASRAPFAPSIGNSIYSASKGAIISYAQCLALELAPQLIRVNSILPAMVHTELLERDIEKLGIDIEQLKQNYPLKRLGKPSDIAYLAIYLLSNASAWMTGNKIDLAGGGELTLK